MKANPLKYTACLFVFAACTGPQGTEVGNGVTPPSSRADHMAPTPDSAMSPAANPPDLPTLALSSHCHSLLAPSRPPLSGQFPQLKPYTASSSLAVVTAMNPAVNAAEKRVIAVDAVPAPPKVTFNGVAIMRQSPDNSATICVDQEVVSTSNSADGSTLIVLDARIKISEHEFTIRIERIESGSASKLDRIELRGANGYHVDWRAK